RLIDRNRDDAAERRVLDRCRVQPAIVAELHALDAVLEVRDLRPLAGVVAQMKCDVAAVAVADRRQQMLAVAASVKLDFRNPRKGAADNVAVPGRGGPERVEPDRLVEVAVGRGPLAIGRITRVVEAAAVGRPLEAAAGGPVGDARDRGRPGPVPGTG